MDNTGPFQNVSPDWQNQYGYTKGKLLQVIRILVVLVYGRHIVLEKKNMQKNKQAREGDFRRYNDRLFCGKQWKSFCGILTRLSTRAFRFEKNKDLFQETPHRLEKCVKEIEVYFITYASLSLDSQGP